MKTLRELLFRLRALFRREKLDAEMREEMEQHLAMRAAERAIDGLSADEARYAAQRAFGGVEQIKERVRGERSFMWLDQLTQDMRYAARSLRQDPGVATVVILTLALGMGANTAIFSFVNALMLRALPVADPARLVQFRSVNGDESFSYPTFQRFRHEARSLAGIAMVQRTPDKRAAIAVGFGATEAEPVLTQAVSGSMFDVLGVPAAVGRPLSAADEAAEQPGAVVVLSHAYWKRRRAARVDPMISLRAE